jgi:hypothetical protein
VLPNHLQFWKDRHAELHGGEKQNSEGSENEQSKTPKSNADTPKKVSPPPSQSYADLERKCCYLCSRQFKTEAEVNKHERLSQLHRDNAKNEELKAKAVAKLVKAGILSADGQTDTAEYRDRAKERRQVFGQPKKPTAANPKTPKSDKVAKDVEEEKPIGPSKGASLLGKMGWSAGQGLGAQGSGIMQPIATDVYVQGVGLGAEGGKRGDAIEEAERQTKGGYEAFLARTKDGAKARFESLKES